MTRDRNTIIREVEGGTAHATVLLAWLGAVAVWAAHCERRRHSA